MSITDKTIAAVVKPCPESAPPEARMRRRAPTARKMAITAATMGQITKDARDSTRAAMADPSVLGAGGGMP